MLIKVLLRDRIRVEKYSFFNLNDILLCIKISILRDWTIGSTFISSPQGMIKKKDLQLSYMYTVEKFESQRKRVNFCIYSTGI